jgi:hypothetical protein
MGEIAIVKCSAKNFVGDKVVVTFVSDDFATLLTTVVSEEAAEAFAIGHYYQVSANLE